MKNQLLDNMWEFEKTKLTAEKGNLYTLDKIIYSYTLLGTNLIIFFQGEINGKLHDAQLWTQEHRKALTSPKILKHLNAPTKIL